MVAVGELQHRGGHRDAALALHVHPVGRDAAAAALAVHRARRGDHLGVQRQRLGERRLAGVGVGDHGEGPAAAAPRPPACGPGPRAPRSPGSACGETTVIAVVLPPLAVAITIRLRGTPVRPASGGRRHGRRPPGWSGRGRTAGGRDAHSGVDRTLVACNGPPNGSPTIHLCSQQPVVHGTLLPRANRPVCQAPSRRRTGPPGGRGPFGRARPGATRASALRAFSPARGQRADGPDELGRRVLEEPVDVGARVDQREVVVPGVDERLGPPRGAARRPARSRRPRSCARG